MIQATHVNNAIELRISNVSKLEFNDLCDTIKAIPGRTYRDGAWLVPDFQLSTVEQLLGGQLVWTETMTPIDTTITKVQKNNLDVLSAALSKVPLKFQPYGFQVLGSAYLIDQARGVLGDEMGLGKAQPLDAKILTNTGWKTMGNIMVGDMVAGSDGDFHKVTGVFPQGTKPVYEVVFSDKSTTRCCDEHLWQVNTPLRRSRGNAPRVLALKDFMNDLTHANGNRQHFIPMVSPINFPVQQVLLDAYVLGVLLGDGGLSTNTVKISSADDELIDIINPLLPNGTYVVNNGYLDWTITSGQNSLPNPVLDALRAYHLMGCNSHTKFVPNDYKFNSPAVRLGVLQGLLDTDGHCHTRNCIEYSTVSAQLADDMMFLVQSLGGTARKYPRVTKCDGKSFDSFRITISLPSEIIPFRLSRRLANYIPKTKYQPSRSFKSVTYVGDLPTQCIMVDASDHLYVTDDFIVTHNTIQAILASYYLKLEGQANQVLVIAPASLKYQWGEEIAKFTDLTYQVIDGTPKQRQAMYEASPQPFFTLINYELARLDFDLNYLKAANYDIIVLDEAHRIKNFESVTAQQFKASLNAPYKWLLTGTPLQNKVEELYSLFEFMDPDILGNWWKFRSRYIVLGSKFGRHNIPVGYKNQNELRTRVQPYIFRRLKSDVRAELPDLPEMLINNYTIPMTSAQTTMYKRVLDEIRVIGDQMMQWNQDTPFPREMEVFGLFTVLAELCTAPELLTLSDSSLARKFIPSDLKSPKLAELKNIVAGIMTEPTSKIVIFSQFERLQSIIASTLSSYGKSVFLNGSMQAYERQVSMDKFRFDDDVKFFISTDAGNYGLNLQNAPYLINMDLHWNPAIWWQRAGRIHRIGSKHESVQVISLVSKDSIDEIILRANYAKMDMSNFLIEKSDYDRMVVDKLTAKVIRKLLAS